MVISEEEYNKKHRRYRFREMGPYQWEEEITATKKKIDFKLFRPIPRTKKRILLQI